MNCSCNSYLCVSTVLLFAYAYIGTYVNIKICDEFCEATLWSEKSASQKTFLYKFRVRKDEIS